MANAGDPPAKLPTFGKTDYWATRPARSGQTLLARVMELLGGPLSQEKRDRPPRARLALAGSCRVGSRITGSARRRGLCAAAAGALASRDADALGVALPPSSQPP